MLSFLGGDNAEIQYRPSVLPMVYPCMYFAWSDIEKHSHGGVLCIKEDLFYYTILIALQIYS